jgi:hypothetical protein
LTSILVGQIHLKTCGTRNISWKAHELERNTNLKESYRNRLTRAAGDNALNSFILSSADVELMKDMTCEVCKEIIQSDYIQITDNPEGPVFYTLSLVQSRNSTIVQATSTNYGHGHCILLHATHGEC